MKKMSLCIVWLAILFCLGGGKKVYAAEVTSVAINQSNFPDKNVRKVIAKEFDKDKNKILSEKELKAAKKLHLYWYKSEFLNIEGISKLKYVKTLSIDATAIKNLSEIKKMPQLTNLTIDSWRNKIIDISQNVNLEKLELIMNLENLDMSRNQKLKEVRLENGDMKQVVITGLNELKRIELDVGSIYSNSITIKNCSKLKTAVIIGDLHTKSITVTDCPKLKLLSCTNTENIKKVTVKNLPRLYRLNLNNMPKIKKWNLPYMPQLRELKMGNSIKKHDFRKVPNLRSLEIVRNRKVTVADLRPLKKLKELTWQWGKLKKIRFANKKKIERLELQHNRLAGTWRLSQFPKLYEFNCNYNRIKKIYAGKHKELNWIYCVKNKLKKLDLYRCTALTTVECYRNPKVKLYLPYPDKEDFYFDKAVKVKYRRKTRY